MQIFFAALELDLYTKLTGGKTVEVLSKALALDGEKLMCFLQVLAGKKLVYADGNIFYPSQEAERFLSHKSPDCIRDVLLYRNKLSGLAEIPELLRGGSCKDGKKSFGIDFAEMARVNTAEIFVFRKEKLLSAIAGLFPKAPKKVLDLGGGSGAMLGIIIENTPTRPPSFSSSLQLRKLHTVI